VRVLKPGGEPDPAEEALGTECRRQLGMEDLERHRPLVPEVSGQEHRRHAATPELPLDDVAAPQLGFKSVAKVGQSGPVVGVGCPKDTSHEEQKEGRRRTDRYGYSR
jgi:hypothetical protein